MDALKNQLSRRDFVATTAAAGAALLASGLPVIAQSKPRIKLGIDNFAVRGMGWKAGQLIDYAASLKTDSLFISDLDAFEKFDAPYLEDLKRKAADKGLQLHVGTWSICPTSKRFKNQWGTA